MKIWQKSLVLCVLLLGAGAARFPFERNLTEDLRTAKLITAPLPISTREKIGQTSSAVALGGLRTLVATFLNLRAYTAFTEQRWPDVEETFDTIVELAPHTTYYWETGAWHMAYNAAPDYRSSKDLSPIRRRQAWKDSILKGKSFLERGIRNNPEDWDLYRNLGFLLADPHKIHAFDNSSEAFAASAEAYRIAADSGTMLSGTRRSQLYSLARATGHEKEALVLAHELYTASSKNHTPTLLSLILALETQQGITRDPAKRALELFGSPPKAYHALSLYWKNRSDFFPMDGIANALNQFEKSLQIPEEKSVLNQRGDSALGSDDAFK